MGYTEQRRWSDGYIPEIKRIVGPLLLTEAPELKDTREATDLIVITARSLDIACRVRRSQYFDDYPFEFTIRKEAQYGGKTELDKIISGFGHWMFYAFAADNDDPCMGFRAWYVIDLSKWRESMIRFAEWNIKKNGPRPFIHSDQSNGDGTSLKAYTIPSFQDRGIIVTSSIDIPWIERAIAV